WDRDVSHDLWLLLLVPVGGPVLFFIIAWVVGGFRKTASRASPQSEPAPHRSTGDYYSVIARAVSELPDNTIDARKALYDRLRTAFATQVDGQDPSWIKNERRTLERAICRVEATSPPRGNRYQPASTVLLIASVIFSPALWVMDFTSMSLNWVVARLP